MGKSPCTQVDTIHEQTSIYLGITVLVYRCITVLVFIKQTSIQRKEKEREKNYSPSSKSAPRRTVQYSSVHIPLILDVGTPHTLSAGKRGILTRNADM
jgi:hypothetical protein